MHSIWRVNVARQHLLWVRFGQRVSLSSFSLGVTTALTSIPQFHSSPAALLPGETPAVCLCVLQVEGVGLYFRQQLLQSRHRGTFELAYVGFVRFTDMLCRCVSVCDISVSA